MTKIVTPDENPFGRNNSVVDTRTAVLMDHVDVVLLTNPSDSRTIVGLQLAGRINQTTKRADHLYLFDADGIASIVTELLGLAERAGKPFADLVQARITDRAKNLPKPGGHQ